MSREHDIRQIYVALTPAALEALANKGLLRRAQKDLEHGEAGTATLTEDGETLTLVVAGHQVRLPATGPARASCSCPASGVCQHILAACLSIAGDVASNPLDTSPKETIEPPVPAGERVRQEWLALEDEAIVQHFGLPALRVAHAWLQEQEPVITLQTDFVVRLPHLNAEIHALAGTGLGGIMVSGVPGSKQDAVAAAAVLAVRRASGKNWEPPAVKGGAAEVVATTRAEVLPAVLILLEEMVAGGLARLNGSEAQRLESLSVSAQATGLPRLSLLLNRLATQVEEWLQRKPQADLARLLADVAQAYALASGLTHQAQPHLAGTPREKYVEVGSLQLTGVAAWPWHTASGYEGVTALFWDQDNSEWCTWTEARPKTYAAGFSAVGRYTGPGPWDGADSPSQLARSRFRLHKAKRSRWGRLSSSAQTRAMVLGSSNLADFSAPVAVNWAELEERFTAGSRPGLREQDPRLAYQVLAPQGWQLQPFDPVSQSLCWWLLDDAGRGLPLRVVYDACTKPLIENLESLSLDRLQGSRLVVRLHRESGQLVAFPLGLIQDSGSQSLGFTLTASPSAKGATPPPLPGSSGAGAAGEGDDDEIEEPTPAATDTQLGPLSTILAGLLSTLEWLAEGGTSSHPVRLGEELREWTAKARALSLRPLLTPLEELCLRPRAAAILRCRWVISVYQSLQ